MSAYHLSIASDYATVRAQWFSFYYGYEYAVKVGDAEEWCLVVKKDEKEVCRIPFSTLNKNFGLNMFTVEECLIAGMAMFFLDNE